MTIEEWAKDFKSYVNALDMQRDDYKGIMEYIDDAIALLKEQDEKNKELQNAYNYLQRQFFEVQDKLLEEQEAVVPKHNPLSPTDWFCGKCGMCISRFHDYCPSCGKAVKWE